MDKIFNVGITIAFIGMGYGIFILFTGGTGGNDILLYSMVYMIMIHVFEINRDIKKLREDKS